MLLSDFSESWQLFYADEARLASFKGNEATPAMRTIRIKVPEKQLSQERISPLESLTNAFGRQVDRFLQLLTMVDYRRFCIGDRYRKLRDHIVEVGADGIEKELIDRAERKRSRKHRDRIEKVEVKKVASIFRLKLSLVLVAVTGASLEVGASAISGYC